MCVGVTLACRGCKRKSDCLHGRLLKETREEDLYDDAKHIAVLMHGLFLMSLYTKILFTFCQHVCHI